MASTKQTKTITPRAVVHRDVKLANLRRAMYGKRRDLLVEDPAVDFAAAARKARGSRMSRRFKRELLREKRTPLRRKPRPRASRGG